MPELAQTDADLAEQALDNLEQMDADDPLTNSARDIVKRVVEQQTE